MTTVPTLLTVPKAAKRLGISENTLRAHIKAGRLRVVRLTDERYRLTPEALREWIRAQEQQISTSGPTP